MNKTPFYTKKGFIFLAISFILLFLNFYLNCFQIVEDKTYKEYETFVEALVLGKMAKAEKDGLSSYAGFPGVNYDKHLIKDSLTLAERNNIEDLYVRDNIITQFKLDQIKYYLNKEETPEDYCVYVSHSGGQITFYYLIQKVLPFDKNTKYQILRLINCVLLSLTFIVLVSWIYRNFGFVSSLISFILIFTSSWLILFGGNGLWWSLWSFFVPFITMLLLLEKRHNKPNSVSNKKIFIWLFFTFIVKLTFSGLEFITTSLLTPFIPIVYYYWLEKRSFKEFFIFSFQSGLTLATTVIIQFAVLIFQLKNLLGTYTLAYQYILNAFVRRSSFNNGINAHDQGDRFADSDSFSFLWNNVIKDYLRGDVYYWGFSTSGFQFFFAYLIGIMLFFAAIVVLFTYKSKERKYNSLLISTALSVICPLSWFIIFKEHAFWHPQIDYIIWYMPFLLLGFAIIGVGVSLTIDRIREQVKKAAKA